MKIVKHYRDTLVALFFLAPALLGFAIFIVYPVITSFVYSFTDFDGISSLYFVGVTNYRALFDDSLFVQSLMTSIYYALFVVPFTLIASLLAALLINQKLYGRAIYRASFFIPSILPIVAIAMVFRMIYNSGNGGILNIFLGIFGIPAQAWLANKHLALPSLMLIGIWLNIGINSIIYLAGLQNISPSLYEAARIDGADGFKSFRYITLPLLKPTSIFVSITVMIGALQVFDQVYIMTQGGPSGSTTVIIYHIYNNAFKYFKQGYASAMSYIVFLLIFILSLVQLYLTREKK